MPIKRPMSPDQDERLAVRVHAADLHSEAFEAAQRELAHLELVPEDSDDAIRTRRWLEWMLDLPWEPLPVQATKPTRRATPQRFKAVAKELDALVTGLRGAKERVIEHLAVRAMGGHGRGTVLCFVGPPGTGKTTMVHAMTKALGRALIELNAGALGSEKDLIGTPHRLPGAWPGALMGGIARAKTRHAIISVEEIDKFAIDANSESAGALLSILDRERNDSFLDRYLGVPFDLSGCLFVATAVDINSIPETLVDRLEIIEFESYTETEKIRIARDHLLPRARLWAGLEPGQLRIGSAALALTVRAYTEEAGVRHLGRSIESLARKAALSMMRRGRWLSVNKTDLLKHFGPAFADDEVAPRRPAVGLASGLAWTPAGGTLLPVETVLMPGNGRMILTGSVGDSMRESVQTAITFVRTRLPEIGLEADAFDHLDIHLHFPSTAVPKDGPSGGVAIAIALISLLANVPVRHDLAMTGEITLSGELLPVGGIRDKVLADARRGYRAVIVPARNRDDVKRLAKSIHEDIEIHLITCADDAIQLALQAPLRGKRGNASGSRARRAAKPRKK